MPPSETKNEKYPSMTLTTSLFAIWVEPPSFLFLVSYSWSSFPGLIFLALSPFGFQVSDSRFQVSDFIFHISDFGFKISNLLDIGR